MPAVEVLEDGGSEAGRLTQRLQKEQEKETKKKIERMMRMIRKKHLKREQGTQESGEKELEGATSK